MRHKEFGSRYWESIWERLSLPQQIRAVDIPEIHSILVSFLPRGPEYSFIEIGCAPGQWIAYFYNEYGYSVSGVEYATKAANKTIENMRRLSIPATIHNIDFSIFRRDPCDIVFSKGFIEHFHDVQTVMKHLTKICKPGGRVVTMIPAMVGINWWLLRTFMPDVAAGHFPMDLSTLISLHESHGFRTCCASYIGCLRFSHPIDQGSQIAPKYLPGPVINFPLRVWNKLANEVINRLGVYPKLRWFNGGAIYIGERRIIGS